MRRHGRAREPGARLGDHRAALRCVAGLLRAAEPVQRLSAVNGLSALRERRLRGGGLPGVELDQRALDQHFAVDPAL